MGGLANTGGHDKKDLSRVVVYFPHRYLETMMRIQ